MLTDQDFSLSEQTIPWSGDPSNSILVVRFMLMWFDLKKGKKTREC